MPDRPTMPEIWTPSQRGVLIAFVLILSACLLIRLACNRSYVSDPQPAKSARFDELADRLDPNIATWQELAVLPQLGEKRAKEIVAYREAFRADRRGDVAFSQADDLLRIRGIGVAMLATMRPHLMFPATNISTNSSTNSSINAAAKPVATPAATKPIIAPSTSQRFQEFPEEFP